jgi:organic radical activating enzyme
MSTPRDGPAAHSRDATWFAVDDEGHVAVERVSIELTQRCAKACWFCYSESRADAGTTWTDRELIAFVTDLAAHGVRAVSFGGGEPLEYDGVFDVLGALRGVLFRSLTSNGLRLHGAPLERLVAAAPDKVHLSIHFPERDAEVARVIAQVQDLEARGIASGVNLLVARSQLAAARSAAERLDAAGIAKERVVFLPMRIRDTPTPREVASVAGDVPFQSMSCLAACARSPRFCCVSWDRTVAHCSYTTARRPLRALTHAALCEALANLDLVYCGGTDDDPASAQLVRLPRRAQHGHAVVRSRS